MRCYFYFVLLPLGECNVISLYFLCCTVNGSVCLVCWMSDSICDLFGQTIYNIFGCGCNLVFVIGGALLDRPCMVF